MRDEDITSITAAWRALLAPMLAEKKVKQDEVAARLGAIAGRGVDQGTVSRWLDGTVPRHKHLQKALRHMLEDMRTGVWPREDDDQGGGEWAIGEGVPAYNEAREEEEMERIGALPDPLLRVMERESIAAVIRAQGMRDACRAARIEAEKAPDRSVATARYRITPMTELPRPHARRKGRGVNGGGSGE